MGYVEADPSARRQISEVADGSVHIVDYAAGQGCRAGVGGVVEVADGVSGWNFGFARGLSQQNTAYPCSSIRMHRKCKN